MSVSCDIKRSINDVYIFVRKDVSSQRANPYIALLDKGRAGSVWVISFPVSLGIYEIAIAGSGEARDNLRN